MFHPLLLAMVSRDIWSVGVAVELPLPAKETLGLRERELAPSGILTSQHSSRVLLLNNWGFQMGSMRTMPWRTCYYFLDSSRCAAIPHCGIAWHIPCSHRKPTQAKTAELVVLGQQADDRPTSWRPHRCKYRWCCWSRASLCQFSFSPATPASFKEDKSARPIARMDLSKVRKHNRA